MHVMIMLPVSSMFQESSENTAKQRSSLFVALCRINITLLDIQPLDNNYETGTCNSPQPVLFKVQLRSLACAVPRAANASLCQGTLQDDRCYAYVCVYL